MSAKLDINIIDKYYFQKSPIKTHLLNSLSSTFKEGEKFFMKAVTAYIKDLPEFRERIIEFNHEESTHTSWHVKMNKISDLNFHNTAIQDLENFTGVLLNKLEYLPKEYKLLITESLEHITYSLCSTALEMNEFELLSSDAREVFLAHSIEETGDSHSSIAKDIYYRVYGNTLERQLIIYPTTLLLSLVITCYIVFLLSKNKDLRILDIFNSSFYFLNPKGWLLKSGYKIFKQW